jgi:hypothetical protein
VLALYTTFLLELALWLVGWFVGSLIGLFDGCLVGWLIDCFRWFVSLVGW